MDLYQPTAALKALKEKSVIAICSHISPTQNSIHLQTCWQHLAVTR